MYTDCHIHMVLDGADWKSAIARHRQSPDLAWIRATLQRYRDLGFSYLRDGGDRWGVGAAARAMAGAWGIEYRTPLAPVYRKGTYGGFLGVGYETLEEYAALVVRTRQAGGDFLKIMVSGLMDFDRPGVLTQPGLPPEEIRELIHIAHREGLAVMVHCNGARAIQAAAEAGAESVEHGAYADPEALAAMAEAGTVWVPTLSAIGNLRGRGRFREEAVEAILEGAMDRVRAFHAMGGRIAPGTDAGAWAVPHGSLTEYALLEEALGDGTAEILDRGVRAIRQTFRPR